MPTRSPFSIGEWYHCYNRGVDKRRIFESARDYERFLLTLFVANGDKPVHVSNLKESRLPQVLADKSIDRGNLIVDVGAYCLMPNHFHLVLQEITEGGIARFMQKLCTGYTMYFNTKRELAGALFAGSFKSKHVPDDRYLKHLIAYVHLNSAELFEPAWKKGRGNLKKIKGEIMKYPYSSLQEFLHYQSENKITGKELCSLYENGPSFSETVADAQAYY